MAKKVKVPLEMSGAMDAIEEAVVAAVLPVASHLKKEAGITELSDDQMARQIIMNIGTRMQFGKETFDQAKATSFNKIQEKLVDEKFNEFRNGEK